MGDRPPVPADPIVLALAAAIREVAQRRAAERDERRGRLAVVDGRREGAAA